jgi:hypothetical protein
MVLSSGPIIRNPRRVPDNVLLTFGVDGDGIIVLNTAGLSANEEVDDVIEGTSAHLGNAANSLIISNTTDDSDIHILVSKGGNSHTAFLADGSTGDTILNAATGQSVDLYVAGTKEYDFSASSLDMNGNSISSSGSISGSNGNSFQLLNETASSTNPTLVPNQTEADTGIGWASDVIHIVLAGGDEYSFSTSDADFNSNTLSAVGASGNEWTANALTLAGGSAAQLLTVQTTGTGVQAGLTLMVGASSTSQADINFRQGDGTGSSNNMQYHLGYDANGNNFRLRSANIDDIGAGGDADIFRVPDGQTTIDANTTWDINVFDDYDDAMVLWRAFAKPNRLNKVGEILQANTDELVEMGVLRRYPDGWIGHNDMRMEVLLAGGIYQNRALIDSQYEEINKRLEAIGA